MSDGVAATAEVVEVSDVSTEGEVTPDVTETPESTPEQIAEQAQLQKQLENQIKKLTLKVDGQEITEELPFEVTKEQAEWLQKELQLSRASQKRMQEAAELRKKDIQTQKELEQFFNALKSNPIEILEQMGIDTKDMSEKRLQEEIKKMEMTEEERQIAELQKKLKDYEEREKAEKKQRELEEQESMRNKYAMEYERDLLGAIEKSNLPKNPEIIQRLAQYMAIAIKNGIDLSFSDIIPLVQESIQNEIQSLIPSLPVDKIMQLLGDENIKKIMDVKKPAPKKVVPPSAKTVEDTTKPKEKEDPFQPKFKKKAMSDFFSKL